MYFLFSATFLLLPKNFIKFFFQTVYIISENKKNPVIDLLLNNFPEIIFNKNNLKLDMVYLLNAYNIVITKSTFLIILNRIF